MSSRIFSDNNKNNMENDNLYPNQSTSQKKVASPIDIPIQEGQGHRRRTRRRRDSEASSSLSSLSETFSSESPSPTTPPPDSAVGGEERMSPEIATSPLLSYFMAHASPVKSASVRQYSSFRDNANKPKLATSPGGTSTLDGKWVT